jgi:hypothetical protein
MLSGSMKINHYNFTYEQLNKMELWYPAIELRGKLVAYAAMPMFTEESECKDYMVSNNIHGEPMKRPLSWNTIFKRPSESPGPV